MSEFISRYRRADFESLAISSPVDLYPSRQLPSGISPKTSWENNWPFAENAGVYMLYSESFELLYVGKTSMNQCLGKRLAAHFGSGMRCIPKADWLVPVRFVINIAVPKEMSFEAPALEEFLITRLRPMLNVSGK